MGVLWLGARVGVVAAALLAIWLASSSSPVVDFDRDIVPLAVQWRHDGNTQTAQTATPPLQGTTVVITGATNGIGLALARTLHRMGASVVVLGRSETRLAALKEELPGITAVKANLANLTDVSRAAEEIRKSLDHIDILVNNAGIHALTAGEELATESAYDRVFVVNYLSHFLLTEKVAPLLAERPRPAVVFTSSGLHWLSDGSDLMPGPSGEPPAAAVARKRNAMEKHRSYANSKVAQLYHARAVRRKNAIFRENNIRTVGFGPGAVLTNILAPSPVTRTVMETFAFPAAGWGQMAALHAMFGSGNDEKSDYYTSTDFSLFRRFVPTGSPWLYRWGVRDAVCMVLTVTHLLLQRALADVAPRQSSPESYNETIADALYEWSLKAVADYLP
jgi:NAD(P)-dependent dehydrogenase (short-subunit alcohol dehydrogenase family)